MTKAAMLLRGSSGEDPVIFTCTPMLCRLCVCGVMCFFYYCDSVKDAVWGWGFRGSRGRLRQEVLAQVHRKNVPRHKHWYVKGMELSMNEYLMLFHDIIVKTITDFPFRPTTATAAVQVRRITRRAKYKHYSSWGSELSTVLALLIFPFSFSNI